MIDRVAPPLTVAELERLVRDVEPSAFFVPPRILRRVIKHERSLPFLGLQQAQHKSYAIGGEALRAIVAGDELGLAPGAAWPAQAILLVQPEADDLAGADRAAVVLDYWRSLFHARVLAAIDRRTAEGALSIAELGGRIARIGRVEFDEVRNVLRQDGRLLGRDDRTVYREFAAVYWGMRFFAPALVPHEFPAISDWDGVEAVLALDVNAPELFAAARLAGAPAPDRSDLPDDEPEDDGDDEEAGPVEPDSARGYERWLVGRAESAATRGNLVRAALLWTQVARRGGPTLNRRARAGARAELERLARRLQPALGFDDVELDRWRRALPVLITRAASGFWAPEARLLYDLQKVCNDHEREVFTVDLVEWARALGRRPIQRSLPHLRAVLISNHLRSAARRLPAARLGPAERDRLERLFRPAVARVEEALRARFRAPIDATLQARGHRPRNLPERVAYDKLVEELLDRIVERGFVTLGDLRDACSRSNLKLPDLAGPVEFWRGDRLLRTDEELAETLDGVYRRGEVYLRALQRLSALAFGTSLGRVLTKFFVLPFGGAFVALEGVHHLLVLFGVHVPLVHAASLMTLGTMAAGLINFPVFRGAFLTLLGRVGRAFRALVIDLPAWLYRQPVVRRVLDSRAFAVLWRFALKPLLIAAPVCGWSWPYVRLDGLEAVAAGASLLVFLSALLNSRLGRTAEEIAADNAVRAWRWFWLDLVPGLFHLILEFFHECVETVDRVLYAVDEWLRFRSGQRRGMLAVKAVLGFVWFFVAYLVRIYVNLLIEPQANPIKHFPVVTVSHKIILPLSKTLTLLIAAPLTPVLGHGAALFIAVPTVLLLPGVFGFLVWEMKENWRLYEANRPALLPRSVVGSHGETVPRLLRPGFHAGTVPKLFAKLRRAERQAVAGGPARAAHARREALHHVEAEVRRFFEREFLALLRQSRALGASGIELGALELATNRIRAELRALDDPDAGLGLAFEELAGALTLRIAAPGWRARLSDAERQAFELAFAGLNAMSGVDHVPEPSESTAALLRDGRPPLPRVATAAIAWTRWVAAWDAERADSVQPARSSEEVRLC